MLTKNDCFGSSLHLPSCCTSNKNVDWWNLGVLWNACMLQRCRFSGFCVHQDVAFCVWAIFLRRFRDEAWTNLSAAPCLLSNRSLSSTTRQHQATQLGLFPTDTTAPTPTNSMEPRLNYLEPVREQIFAGMGQILAKAQKSDLIQSAKPRNRETREWRFAAARKAVTVFLNVRVSVLFDWLV